MISLFDIETCLGLGIFNVVIKRRILTGMSKFNLASLVVGILSAKGEITAVFRLSQKAGGGNDCELKTKFLLLMVVVVGPKVKDLLDLPHWQTSVACSDACS